MPAVSKAQRTAMAIAKNEPGKLFAKNKGMLKMSKSELSKFASTKTKGLPKYKGNSKQVGKKVSK